MPSHNRLVYETWISIQDIIGDARRWPYNIRRLFWTPFLTHFNRLLISDFVYVNGLNPSVFLEWIDLIGLARDTSAWNHFTSIQRLFEQGRYSRALYAYNVTNNRYEYLNGTPIIYIHASKR